MTATHAAVANAATKRVRPITPRSACARIHAVCTPYRRSCADAGKARGAASGKRAADAGIDEALDELGRGDRAGATRADILHVRDRAVDQLVVGVAEREAPQQVATRLARREQLIGERIVIGEATAMLAAEADDHRAGQGREVDNGLRMIVALHPRDRVEQPHPPFCVGVEHFDRLA